MFVPFPNRAYLIFCIKTFFTDNFDFVIANAEEQNEAPLYDQWAYPPYPVTPYWPEHYPNYYYPAKEDLPEDIDQNDNHKKIPTLRVTPVPFWDYMPPYYPPKTAKGPSEENYESSTSSRSTPVPFWNLEYYYPSETESTANSENPNCYPYYPPYYDPYYYHYYYGYPPMYPPPYYYGSSCDDFNGYSSAEELNSIKRNSNARTDCNCRKPTTPLDIKEKIHSANNITEKKCNVEDDPKTKTENAIPIIKLPSLKSIKSVHDMKIYEIEGDLGKENPIEECSDYTTEDTDEETSVDSEEEEEEQDEYPHQLSVIMEESEKTDSRLRSLSVMSDTSTLSDKTGVEEDEPQLATLTLPQRNRSKSREKSEMEHLDNPATDEITASFTIRSSSSTPRISEDRLSNIMKSNSHDEDELQNTSEEYFENTEKRNTIIGVTKEEDEEDGKESDESEDWWGILGKEEDDLPRPKTVAKKDDDILGESKSEEVSSEEVITNSNLCNNQISNKEKSQLDTHPETKRRSVYDLDDDEGDQEEIISGRKLLEMESFVEQLEQLKRNSGLWNLAKAKSLSKVNYINNKSIDCHHDSQTNERYNTKGNDTQVERQSQTIAGETKTNSADYNQYNYSESSQLVSEENNIRNERTFIDFENEKNIESDTDSEESSVSDSSSSDEDRPQNGYQPNSTVNSTENEVKMLSIQERINALKNSIKQKQSKIVDQDKVTVKEKISPIEANNQSQSHSKTTSTKSSVKSFEEYSEEEEVDSGVTSDMSRHISDNEEFPELKKLTRYQRAATHSRLFKLLQEECENEENNEEYERSKTQSEPFTRDLLNLPLKGFSESESSFSSGISSPNNGVNEKLVTELIQSLLKRKKGQIFKNMPKEKLFLAAAKVLQEEMDILETPSDYSSFLSPLRNGTGYSTAAQTPQEFNTIYDEYKQYYESWNEADIDNKTECKTGLLPKGSKAISSKHIHKKIMKLLDGSHSSPPLPSKPLDSNEVTTAS